MGNGSTFPYHSEGVITEGGTGVRRSSHDQTCACKPEGGAAGKSAARDPGGDAERLVREATGGPSQKIP